ncbi:hypothetical protein LF1_05940 [Rubripirellula obstinata]|uniref:DUF3696 domain-containing protein n=1 Tax=Rubripirellula obstinata TaxID=406547 RepID=A0A5B1CE88_9BACT|nr:DUF3696 domain-containing protein [Rubripirellula obstinata]KAA1258079.1 hypothetical protein LF1_05940 [Rubripirellula obstinata]
MLREIELGFFKCFERIALPLAPLTVLTGTNASGKSSVFQALVLLRQTMVIDEWSKRLYLNGPDLELGTVADVIDKVNGRYEFELGVNTTDEMLHWHFAAGKSRDDFSIDVGTVRVNKDIFGGEAIAKKRLQNLVPEESEATLLTKVLRGLTYLTAERTGPRPTYELRDNEVAKVVGPRGDNAIGILHQNRTSKVEESLVISPKPNNLLTQVGNRMNRLFPGASIDVQKVPRTNFVTLGVRTSDSTDFHRPTHVGFGLTQTLPVIVACLNASPGDLLLIENPEVHLHPSGQAMMGEFLASVSAAGVQVLVETHSDHVLNGVRRAVKGEKTKSSDVAIHFFQSRDIEGNQVTSPTLNQSGEISDWPDGFFDQFDKDMNFFAGWGE